MVLIEEWERCGCKVEFLDRPMSHDPHDQLVLQIRGAVAEYERVLISDRMRRGRLAKLRAGQLLPWSRPPYGYQVDPAHPRDPARAARCDYKRDRAADLCLLPGASGDPLPGRAALDRRSRADPQWQRALDQPQYPQHP